MRLFVGIELDESVKTVASEAIERLRARLKRSRVRLDARWVPPENLHITLWFIGEVNEERAAQVRAALDAPFTTREFDLVLAGCGAFPPSGSPRVFWIGVHAGAESLSALHGEVAARLLALGFEAERRPYSAHLTIARVKDASRGSSAAVRRALSATAADLGRVHVNAVTLFRSHPSPKGSTYEPLARVPLQR
jgi:2'-5' RNA ligase